MKYLIIITSLILILVNGGIFFGLRLVDMTERIHELELNYATLQFSNDNLQSSYDALEDSFQTTMNNYNALDANYKVLESYYNSLSSQYQSLEADYFKLESDYDLLKSEHDTLKGELSSFKISYNQLQAENRDMQRLLNEYEKVPHSYYSSGAFDLHSNTWEELSEFLSFEFFLPRGYKENVFDCSESAAYLEWALENAGFDAEIATSRTPWSPTSGQHAWVIADTTEYQVAIEATALTGEYNWMYLFSNRIPGVVYGDDELIPGWNNYYEGYDNMFQNIYYAIRSLNSVEEWNWWEGFWGFK